MIASSLGRFLGGVLAECAPILSEIIADAIRNALDNPLEVGGRRDSLRERLLGRLRESYHPGTDRGAGETQDDNSAGEGLGR